MYGTQQLAQISQVPDHCTPTTSALLRLSTLLYICIPTPLAFLSTVLGCMSLVSWLFAQLPQIYKNYQIKSTAGLSVFFLAEWLLGDLTNLIGAVLTHQAGWQVSIATYYVFVDVCLMWQHFWYGYLRTTYDDGSVHSQGSGSDDNESDMFESLSPIDSDFASPRDRACEPAEGMTRTHTGQSTTHTKAVENSNGKMTSQLREDSTATKLQKPIWGQLATPRTIMAAATAMNYVQAVAALPTSDPRQQPGLHLLAKRISAREYAGAVISWSSTFLYLGSRLPQIYKNWRRQSTAGLSPLLFFAAFCGNSFYTTSLLANPRAWSDLGPYGGHGWVNADGSKRGPWIANTAPFFLGAFGCLGLDIMIGIQFVLYGEEEAKIVKVRDRYGGRWERVSGWMRGWIPVVARERVVDMSESQRLLSSSRELARPRRSAQYGST